MIRALRITGSTIMRGLAQGLCSLIRIGCASVSGDALRRVYTPAMSADAGDTSTDKPTPTGWRTWVGRVLLSLVSLGLALLVADLALRWLEPGKPGRTWSIYQPDEELLYRLVPDSERIFRHNAANGGVAVPVRVNHLGFRGADFDIAKTAPRVVVYGDSFVACEFSPLEETLTERLRARLEEAMGEPVQCVNAGVVGYGPDQVLLRMEQELGWLDPDLVVVALFSGNDYGDLVRNRLFGLAADDSLERRKVVLSPEMIARWHDADTKGLVDSLRAVNLPGTGAAPDSGVDRHQVIKNALVSAARDYQRFVVEGDRVVNETTSDYYDADVAIAPKTEAVRYKRRLMERVMEGMALAADAHSVPILFLVIPAPMDVCDGYPLSVDTDVWPDYRAPRLCKLMVDMARRLERPVLDLFPVFRGHDPCSLYFGNGDNHWNAAGEDLAATALTEEIVSRGWLGTPR